MAINTTIPNVIEGEIRKLPLNQNFDWTLSNLVDLQAQVSANDVDITNRYTKSEVNALDANLQTQVTTNKNTIDSHVASVVAHDANNIVLTSENPYLTASNVESGLEQISDRVSTIIAQSGTSSTEVVDSRTSSTYGVFTTLGNRLNSSDIKLKVLEDEIETQNVGTLPMTPSTSNQSPTDSYSGIVDAEIGGATLNQTLVNGNFANGATGWIVGGGTFTVTSKKASVVGNGTFPDASIKQTLPLPYKAGTKLFILANAKVTNSVCTNLRVRLSTTAFGNVVDLINQASPTINNVYTAKTIVTLPSDASNLQLYFQEVYADSATANGKVMEVDGNVGVFAIPLTGTPYESLTADQIKAMIPTYFEGLNSTKQVEVNASGKNLFDGLKITNGKFVAGDGTLGNNVLYAVSDYTTIKPNTQYKVTLLSGFKINAFYDRYKNFISFVNTDTFTSPTNTAFVRFNINVGTEATTMLNEGSIALPYQPYKPSQLTVNCTNPTKFELSQLPNLVQNEINQVKGFPSAVKRNARFTAISTDIDSLITTGVNVDYVTIPVSKLTGSVTFNPNVAEGNSIVEGFLQRTTLPIDDASKIGKHIIGGASIVMIVAKGTYANLASAQTALAGTKIIYQLATPSFIPFEDFNDYGIEFDGALVSHDDYTNVNYSGDLLPDLSLEYPRNLGACVDGLSQSMGNIYDIATQTNLDLQTKKQKNYIINGGFDIWQRAFTQSSSGYDSDDRWFNQNIGSTKTHSQQIFTIGQTDVPNNPIYFSRTVVSSVAGVGNTCAKWQAVEDVRKLSGKTVSLSFYAKSDTSRKIAVEFTQSFGISPDLNSIEVQTIQLTTAWQKFTVTANLPSVVEKSINNASSTAILFWFDAGSNYNTRTNSLGQQSGTFDISSVCLVEGSNPQDYQSENVDDVKKQCQRYLFDLSGTYRMGYHQTNYLGFALPSLLSKMRTTPVIYNTGAIEVTDYQVYTINGTGVTGFTISLPTASEIRATKSTHGLTDALLEIRSKTFADSEL